MVLCDVSRLPREGLELVLGRDVTSTYVQVELDELFWRLCMFHS